VKRPANCTTSRQSNYRSAGCRCRRPAPRSGGSRSSSGSTVERRRMTTTEATDFDIARLRARRTNKWHKFPPDVLPAWVADMDFGVAPSITAALARLNLTRNQEYGYAARDALQIDELHKPHTERGGVAQEFADDSPLEGDGFELLVPRHESPRFPKHPARLRRRQFEPQPPLGSAQAGRERPVRGRKWPA
jgi:hypothetical protein